MVAILSSTLCHWVSVCDSTQSRYGGSFVVEDVGLAREMLAELGMGDHSSITEVSRWIEWMNVVEA